MLAAMKSSVDSPALLQRVRGEATCTLVHRDNRTVLDDLRQSGSFKLRFPKGAGTDHVEAILINTAGGLTDGDSLVFDGEIGDGACGLFTTQACERAYAAREGCSDVDTRLRVGVGGHLAWLPQETILFDEASMRRRLEVDLQAGSTALLHESVVFGRLARGEAVRHGFFSDDWRIRYDGELIHAEAFRIDGEIGRKLGRTAALGVNAAMTTIVSIAPHPADLLEGARAIIADFDSETVTAAASAWEGKLVVRAVAADGFHLRRLVVPLLKYLNNGLPLPRVWSL